MRITEAQPEHAAAIATLLDELDQFYGASEPAPREERIREIHKALWGKPPGCYALLAWDGGASLVGFASYSFLWPAVRTTRSLYLKELYVIEAYRARGLGALLMQELCQIALRYGCSRVEWTTDLDNSGAQAFYEHLNFPQSPSKLFYRLEKEDLRKAAETPMI
jgi:GNAT superfamily N-acetyltransferase